MMKQFILFTIFIFVFSRVTHAALPPSFRTGRITLQLESEYFKTDANYDLDGESQKLLSDNNYTNIANTFTGTYFLDGGWSLGGGFGYAYATSESIENRTNGKLTHLLARGQKLFAISLFRLIPEVELTMTTDKIEEDRDEVLTSEGTNGIKAGTWLTMDVWRFRAYGYAGFDYRDDGRAGLMPWRGGLALRQAKWFFSGEMGGIETITDDEYIDSRFERTLITSRTNAGSLRYYSVNPRLVEMRALAGFEILSNLQLSLGYGQTLIGKSTADGQSLFLALTYNIETQAGASPVTDSPRATRKLIHQDDVKSRKARQKDEEFEPEIENDYDDSLFEEDL